MANLLDLENDPAKILLIGKTGAGKTGALASLVAAGYKLRILDTDKGVRVLRSLLTHPNYPYGKLIKAKNIDLATALDFIPVSTGMKLRRVQRKMPNGNYTEETILAPVDAKAWTTAVDKLDEWKDGKVNYGPVREWGQDTVLVIDSFSTLAKCAYYFNQAMNGRLGARDEGFDYQRDIGGAQSQLTRLLELIFDSSIKCNVVVISHITWVDDSQGTAQRPKTQDAQGNFVISSADGYPSAIGRALSPQMGKYFNDTYIARSTGSGINVNRTISTVPQDGVLAKNSVYLDREYPTSYGLAAIFSALRYQSVPQDLIDACAPKPKATVSSIPQQPAAARA